MVKAEVKQQKVVHEGVVTLTMSVDDASALAEILAHDTVDPRTPIDYIAKTMRLNPRKIQRIFMNIFGALHAASVFRTAGQEVLR